MGPVSTATTRPTIIVHAIESICVRQSQTPIFRLDPLGEHEREEITAEIDFTVPFASESEGWSSSDQHAGRLRRLHLVLGGGSTGYAAMDRIVLEGARKYHYSNHPTYASRSIPSVSAAQHWDEQSDVAPYPIIRPSCYYDSKRRYNGDEMRQIVELSRSYMQGYRANQGDFDLDEARLLRSTEHVSVLLLNFGDINRVPHFNGKQPLPRELADTDQYAVLPRYLVRNTTHILRSCWRRMALNDTESFSTNTSVCVSSPYQMVNHHQLQD